MLLGMEPSLPVPAPPPHQTQETIPQYFSEEPSPQTSETSGETARVREIYKNGWLLRLTAWDKKGSVPCFFKLPKPEKLWVVLCIHDDVDAFLEYYETRLASFSHQPKMRVALSECLHVSPSIIGVGHCHEFTVTLVSEVVRLSAATRDQMQEWVDILRTKLTDLHVLEPKENIYSSEPELKHPLAPSRDPNSPLPPTPGLVSLPPGTVPPMPVTLVLDSRRGGPEHNEDELLHHHFDADLEHAGSAMSPSGHLDTGASVSQPNSAPIPNDSNGLYGAILRHPRHATMAEPEDMAYGRHSLPVPAAETIGQVTPNVPLSAPLLETSEESHRTDNVFSFDDVAPAVPSRSAAHNAVYEPLHLAHTPPTFHEHRNPDDPLPAVVTSQSNGVGGQADATPARAMSLKEAQVANLQREINHPGGVRLRLRQKDCVNSIAFVDYLGAVWVAGWKQRERPLLHNSFHIGDKILSIAHRSISSSQEAYRVLKQICVPQLEIIVARVPFGKAFAIKRDFDGQDLGLLREHNTAEIRDVISGGLAARHGLTLRALSPCGTTLCNWTLTEVNGRPLNLFFKDSEIQDRLNAVGKDISILVQPSDFVKVLRKQLKSLRCHKDYIVQ